ncbi:hypothetical protein LJR290_007406 [Variovorax sp. LjRoot290]
MSELIVLTRSPVGHPGGLQPRFDLGQAQRGEVVAEWELEVSLDRFTQLCPQFTQEGFRGEEQERVEFVGREALVPPAGNVFCEALVLLSARIAARLEAVRA